MKQAEKLSEKLSEKFSNTVGDDLNNQFENQVYVTIMDLIKSLENRFIDNETNKTSYVENCETSSWGRALANFGIGLDTSVASADEVQNAIKNQNKVSSKTPAKTIVLDIKKTQYSVFLTFKKGKMFTISREIDL